MKKSIAYQSWIDAGYDLFAREGMDGIQVERLARQLDLNKSGFYHYFGNRDAYLKRLMDHHRLMCGEIVNEIATTTNFDPDYLHVLVKHKIVVIAHMQLVRNRHIDLLASTFTEMNQKIDQALVPIWSEFLGIPDQPALALRYYEIIHDAFFSRVTFETMTFEFLHEIASEAKKVMQFPQQDTESSLKK